MTQTEPWGFALVVFDEWDTVFPLHFDEPFLPLDILTSFNQLVKKRCARRREDHTHVAAIKSATEMLESALVGLLDDTKTDHGEIDATTWAPIGASIGIISLLTRERFWVLRCKENAAGSFQGLPGSSREAAERAAHRLLAMELGGRDLRTFILSADPPKPPAQGRAW